MELGGIGLITVFIAILSAIALVYFIMLIYSGREKAKNEPYIINTLSSYTSGHGILVQKSKESNKDIHMIKADPRDIDYSDIEDKGIILERQNLFPRRDLFLPFGISNHRQIFLALTDNPEDLPHDMDEDLRKALGEVIEKKNSKKDNLQIKNIRENNLLKITKKLEGMQIFEEAVDLYGEITKDAIRLRNQESQKVKDNNG